MERHILHVHEGQVGLLGFDQRERGLAFDGYAALWQWSVTDLEAFRVDSNAAYAKAKSPVKLTMLAFVIKASVAALKKFPAFNASLDEPNGALILKQYYNIGFAADTPNGLVVPVLKDADKKGLVQISQELAELSKKARDGKLGIEEMTGGTFSISNGGVFGSMLSTPIINPPQSAILGVHATKERAVVENGQVVVRPMNYLAMSYDHRIIDGREAVLGLVTMKDALEDPARLLFDI